MRRISLAISLVVLASVSGCGGSSVSPAKFAAKANAVCRAENAKIALLWKEGGSGSQGAEKQVAVAAEAYTAKLRAIKPPSKEAADYQKLLASYDRQASKLRKMAETTSGTIDVVLAAVSVTLPDGTKDLAGVSLPASAEPDRLASIRIARSLGISACTGSTSAGMTK